MPKTILCNALLLFAICGAGQAATLRPEPAAEARGLAVNLPLVARLVGSGNVLYVTSLDVSNHSTSDAQVDFYFDGVNATTQTQLVVTRGTWRMLSQASGGGSPDAFSNYDEFVVISARVADALENQNPANSDGRKR